MGRGSFANRGGSGGGAIQNTGIENGMMYAGGLIQEKVDDITDSIKPDSTGLVPSQVMKKAGSDLNKLMDVGDQFEITFADGTKKTYEKISSTNFQSGQFTYKSVQVANDIAAYKYPNPNLKAANLKFTINRKLSQAQQNAADSIMSRVKQIKGTGLKFSMQADRTISFQYKNSQGNSVYGGINKNGVAKIMQVFGGTQGGF